MASKLKLYAQVCKHILGMEYKLTNSVFIKMTILVDVDNGGGGNDIVFIVVLS